MITNHIWNVSKQNKENHMQIDIKNKIHPAGKLNSKFKKPNYSIMHSVIKGVIVTKHAKLK